MQTIKISLLLAVFLVSLVLSGCNADMQELRVQNQTQRQRIAELESNLEATKLKLDQLNRQLGTIGDENTVEHFRREFDSIY